jgi:hypothetical protein
MSVAVNPIRRARPTGRPIVMSRDRIGADARGAGAPAGPTLVLGGLAAQLAGRRAEMRGADGQCRTCASWTALLVAARALRPSHVVVEMSSQDPFESAAHRALRRLGTVSPNSVITVIAIDPTPDGWALIRETGAHAIVAPDGSPLRSGRPRWSEAEWQAWLLTACGLQAEADTEAILALMAPAGDRSVCADDMVERGLASSRPVAVRRLRDIAKALGGEEHRSPGIVAHEARRALAGLAAARPLQVRPTIELPLLAWASRLNHAPSLAVAAGMTAAEIDALRDLARLMSTVRRDVGAPHGGASRDERDWAAGRRAAELGADAASIAATSAQCLSDAQGAALAVADAAHEAPLAPRAHLAAAVEALAVLPEALRPSWAGRVDPSEWALDAPHVDDRSAPDRLPDAVVRRLTGEVDRLLAQHGALDRWVESGRGGSAQR